MKYLKKVNSLPTELKENTLYYSAENNKILLKKENKKPTLELIDLGLSVKWASCNIGATKPEERGLYFQWGATQGYAYDTEEVKAHSTWETCPFNNGEEYLNTQYFASIISDVIDTNTSTLKSEYDGAYTYTNGECRTPTIQELIELTANTTSAYTQLNNVSGITLTSKKEGYTDKSIFLPFTSYYIGGDYMDRMGRNDDGRYRSSSLDMQNISSTPYLYIYYKYPMISSDTRQASFPIRPVSDK